jgi:hypothetical protein
MITLERSDQFARIALGHVRREYPHRPGYVLAGKGDAREPRAVHPVFYGSFDWHSCVHGFWMLARLLRRHPNLPAADEIRLLFDTSLVPEKIARECAFLAAPTARGFERPYGWAWLLKLAAELTHHHDHRWSLALAPLAEIFALRFQAFLPLATYAVRTGSHGNTAFALRLAADYATVTQDTGLSGLLLDTARRWYGEDTHCPAWGEPGGDDFLSPALIEAECMRRLLPQAEFCPWFEQFLPRTARGEPAVLFWPATVSDRSDGKLAHLDGLNLSRAWCWRAIASALPLGEEHSAATEAAERHLAVALPHIAGEYMGEHWLASFAVLAMIECA